MILQGEIRSVEDTLLITCVWRKNLFLCYSEATNRASQHERTVKPVNSMPHSDLSGATQIAQLVVTYLQREPRFPLLASHDGLKGLRPAHKLVL